VVAAAVAEAAAVAVAVVEDARDKKEGTLNERI